MLKSKRGEERSKRRKLLRGEEVGKTNKGV